MYCIQVDSWCITLMMSEPLSCVCVRQPVHLSERQACQQGLSLLQLRFMRGSDSCDADSGHISDAASALSNATALPQPGMLFQDCIIINACCCCRCRD